MWSSPLCAPPLVQWSHHCGWSLCSLTTARHHLPILSMCDLLLLCFVSVFMCSFFSPAPPPMQWLTTTTCQFWVCTCDLLLICCYEGGGRRICEKLAKTNDLICCPLSRHVFSWKIWDINIFVLAIHTDVTFVVNCWCFYFCLLFQSLPSKHSFWEFSWLCFHNITV